MPRSLANLTDQDIREYIEDLEWYVHYLAVIGYALDHLPDPSEGMNAMEVHELTKLARKAFDKYEWLIDERGKERDG